MSVDKLELMKVNVGSFVSFVVHLANPLFRLFLSI
jgi:hypothetical protein